MATESKVDIRGPPRFPAPIAKEKIRREPPPPNMFELLETFSAKVPEGIPGTTIGTGTGIDLKAPVAEVPKKPKTLKPRGPKLPGLFIPPPPPEEGAEGKVEADEDLEQEELAAAPPAEEEEEEAEEEEEEEEAEEEEEEAEEEEEEAEEEEEEAEEEEEEAEEEPPNVMKQLQNALTAIVDKDKIVVKPEEGLYVPANRRKFKEFIIQTYRRYYLPAPPAVPDPDACAKAAAASKSEVKTFAYQAFVRDYIQKPSPYRGVLVYHGLGSGKTCTSIASFEALYQAGQKPVYIMTPASLSPNYRDEITKCGPFVFRTNNHWIWIDVANLKAPTPESELLMKILGIPRYSVQKRKGGWFPNPQKPANFDKLSPEQKQSIQEQIREHMDSRIQFIHYNGLQEKTVRKWACDEPTKFDGATIIIDEVHNLIRTINNSGLDRFYKDEPRTLAQYHPKFCAVGVKYRISYLLYRILCNAVGCKIVALSATPIINFPQEIALLANLLSGDTRMVEVNTPGIGKRKEILAILERHPEVDFAEVLPRPEVSTSTIRITPVPSGYRKVIDPATGAFRGFVRLESLAISEAEIARERDLESWWSRIRAALAPVGVASFAEPQFSSVTRLPDLEKPFREMFIDTDKLEVKAAVKFPLMARLSGLISYYKGGKADLMAKVTRDEVVLVDMSDMQLKKYTEQRKVEIDKELRERKKKKEPAKAGAGTAVGYADVTKNQNSTFKIFSRATCNFAFPDDIPRPVPADYRDELRMIGAKIGKVSEDGEEGAEGTEEEGTDAAEEIVDIENDPAGAAAAGAGAEAPKKETFSETYQAALVRAVTQLRARAPEFFSKETLRNQSPKFQAIIDRLLETQGPALVYSNFKTLEGVGLFGLALETQLGYKKFDIVQSGTSWSISPETLTGGKGTSRYITYTGDEDRTKRNILLAIFNGKWNKVPASLATAVKELTGEDNNMKGGIAKVFMITQSGAEGISLANVRQVHIMEPYWNYVRLEQVKGRAIRICSHMDLPPEERTVDVFTYIAQFSERQKKNRSVDETLLNFDGGDTTDINILNLLNAKKKLSDSLLDVMKGSAVDCELNHLENSFGACYRIAGKASMEPLFHPIVDIHIAESAAAIRATIL